MKPEPTVLYWIWNRRGKLTIEKLVKHGGEWYHYPEYHLWVVSRPTFANYWDAYRELCHQKP